MNNILPIVYMLFFAGCGILIARPVFKRDDPLRRLFFGLVFGLMLLIWLPVLFAFLMDFTLAAQLIAAAAAALMALAATLVSILKVKKEGYRAFEKGELKKLLVPLLLTVLPIIAICFILHIGHTIRPASNGSLHVGQCTYGDLCMHLGFISSISVQKTFPPEYSLLPGTPLGYPFLCDSVSSTFLTLGADLRWAALLPALYACVVVALGVYFFFDTWFKNTKTTVLATVLFFIGGGFGFWYFFNNKQLLAAEGVDRMKELMEGFYKMPTNLPAEGLRWVNSIADMLLPQRATLFGWAMLFPALQLLFRGAVEKENRVFIPLAFLAGSLPLIHTHSFLALGIISAVLFIAALLRLMKLRRPGDGSALGARTAACFIVMALLGALYLLPIRAVQEGVDTKIVTVGMIAAGAAALVFCAVSFVRLLKKAQGALGVLLFAAGIAVAGVIAVFGIRSRNPLAVLAPLAGLLCSILFALTAEASAPQREALKAEHKNLLLFAIFGVITLILACPQLFGFTLKQSGSSDSFLRWQFNWDNESDGWLWFYIKNLGLIFILMPTAFLFLKKEHRPFFGGALAIWGICEILLFQPNPYDNNKLLFVWFALCCGAVANLLSETLMRPSVKTENGETKPDGAKTAGRFILAVIAIAALTTSGVMTLAREYVSMDHIDVVTDEDGSKRIGMEESGYELVPANYMELVEWIKQNTEPDATFLSYNNHNNAIAMLTGRNLFVGSPTFLHWHGVNYGPRQALLDDMYEDPENCLRQYAAEYGIDYVLISSFERGNYRVDEEWFESNLECVYTGDGVALYKVGRGGRG